MRVLIPGMAFIGLCCAGCAPAEPAAEGAPPSPVAIGTASRDIVVEPVPAAPPGNTPPSAGSTPLPSNPARDGVLSTAQMVAEAWMRQWCAFDWREPINANLDRAAKYQTAAAARADRARGDNARSYQALKEQQLSSRCDDVAANPHPEAPQTPDMVYLLVTAERTNLAAGVAFETETVRSARRVERQPDGRWLVGDQVEAG